MNMDINTVAISALTAVITAVLVAGVNHYWNRRYLLLVEREKYRQALFRKKVKIFDDIALAIHTAVTFAIAETSVVKRELNGIADVHNVFAAIKEKVRDVYDVIHRNAIWIPIGVMRDITDLKKIVEKKTEIVDADELFAVNKNIRNDLYVIVALLRADLGVEEFGKKIE